MAKRESQPITKAGRRRVQRALEQHGMLLVQGQAELPSLADLLAGKSITTKGSPGIPPRPEPVCS